MSLQANLNNQAIKSLGLDFSEWMSAQNDHHENQIRCKAVQYMCNNKMPETCPQNDIYIEGLIRSCDSSFRSSEGYLSWSKWWTSECGEEFGGDENIGFSYTNAEYNELNYCWNFK